MTRRMLNSVRSFAVALAVLLLVGAVDAQTPARGSRPARPAAAPGVGSVRLDGSVLNGIPLRLIGPNAPAGRVWSVVGVPSQPKTFYACTAEGGVWRTTNNGTTMTPIFDEENAASCGAVAIAPSDPNQIWVGTGEPAGRQSNALGYGVYKSLDGGKTFQHLGLEATEEIAAILIDPHDPQTVYVGAAGHLWGRNEERGVYKTTDGGRTWRKVLYVDDMTGVMDLGIDPRDPKVLYATTWQRLRSGGNLMREAGPGERHLQERGCGRALDKIDEWASQRAFKQNHARRGAEDTGAGLRLRHVRGAATARWAIHRWRPEQPVRRHLPLRRLRRHVAAREPETRLAHLLYANVCGPLERPPAVHRGPAALAIG